MSPRYPVFDRPSREVVGTAQSESPLAASRVSQSSASSTPDHPPPRDGLVSKPVTSGSKSGLPTSAAAPPRLGSRHGLPRPPTR